MNKKDRRHSGWVTPSLMQKIPTSEMINDPELLPQDYYNDWMDERDGYREWHRDMSKNKVGIIKDMRGGSYGGWSEEIQQLARRTKKNKILNERRRLMKTLRPR